MTREEAISIMNVIVHMLEQQYDTDRVEDAVEMAIKALEQEPCEDCVSKDAVLDLVADYDLSMGQVVKGIHNLPSVTPQQKTGRLILLDECSNSGYYCSECHKKVVKEGWSNTVKKIKYCPNCGCKMQEVKDES